MQTKLIPVLLLSLIVAGCQLGITGSGVSKTEQRNVEDFDSVSLSGTGDVTIQVGQPKSVEVTLDDNLIGLVETRVENGKLIISAKEMYNTKLGLKVKIGTPNLTAASVSGVGDMTILEATGDELELTVSGVGDITAKGTVKSVKANVSGTGDANLKDLIAETVSVSVSGVGDAKVNATKSVDATASGVGNVEIYGNPADVKRNASGVGSVTIKN